MIEADMVGRAIGAAGIVFVALGVVGTWFPRTVPYAEAMILGCVLGLVGVAVDLHASAVAWTCP